MYSRLLRSVLLAMLLSAMATPAQASVRQSWSLLGFSAAHSGAPLGGLGQRSAAPSQQALAATLGQMTGLVPSQVTTTDACGAARPGFVRCDAQVMILRSTRTVVRPHVGARTHQRSVIPSAGAAPSGVSAAAVASAAPPQAGTPAFIQQAYDMAYLSQTAGAGDTVAVIAAYDDPTAESDLATYRSTYALGACTSASGCFTKVNQSGAPSPLPGTNSAWQMEISLDLDAVSAMCPRCKILLVEANTTSWSDMQAAVSTAASIGADQISVSWSSPAASPPAGSFTFPGVATVAATGDFGYTGVGQDNYPAAYADVTAAGGTKLTPASSGTGARGFAESAWSVDRAGMSAGSGCDLSLTKPPYQTDSGCTGRAYADVSADADPSTGLVVYDSGKGGWIVAGGTSLASPLIAAYYAATGVSAPTPQWAYADSALLNDPISGSNGTCGTAVTYICVARAGYDGPTGVGSISGAVADGAPGIGGPSVGTGTSNSYAQTVTSSSATLLGGVFPNGLDTTYWWEYGTSTAYGQQTPVADIGSGRTPVTVNDTLSGLAPRTIYHYRLVAKNSLGTSYGFDYALTSAVPPPANTSPPSITGLAREGQTLYTSAGSWTPAQTSFSYQWQRDTGSGFANIVGAIGYNYVLGSRRPERERARDRHGVERLRHGFGHQREHRPGPLRRARQHGRPDNQRHPAATRGADVERRQLESGAVDLRDSVAARHGRRLRRHRRRGRLLLRAREGRRGRDAAGRAHRSQHVRVCQRDQRRGRSGDRQRPRHEHHADDQRYGEARLLVDGRTRVPGRRRTTRSPTSGSAVTRPAPAAARSPARRRRCTRSRSPTKAPRCAPS